jgi:hypothetical protein
MSEEPGDEGLRGRAIDTRVALEIYRSRYMAGDPLALLEAARVALWAAGTEDLHAAFEKALDRYRSRGPGNPCLGDAFNLPHRKAPAVENRLVPGQRRSTNLGQLLYRQVLKRRRAGQTREQAFDEVSEWYRKKGFKVGEKLVEKIYDMLREVAREVEQEIAREAEREATGDDQEKQ